MLGINSATAQSHTGKWKIEQEFRKLLNDDPNLDIDLMLEFSTKDIYLHMVVTTVDEDLTMKCSYTIPGTYTKLGKEVTAKYTPEKSVFKLIDLKSKDPEINKLMASEDTKDFLFAMVESEAKKEILGDIGDMKDFIDLFSKFLIEKVTADLLTLNVNDGAIVNFDRTK